MSEPTELAWIMAGYTTFAERGPEALKVEQLARQVGISKSSFEVVYPIRTGLDQM